MTTVYKVMALIVFMAMLVYSIGTFMLWAVATIQPTFAAVIICVLGCGAMIGSTSTILAAASERWFP